MADQISSTENSNSIDIDPYEAFKSVYNPEHDDSHTTSIHSDPILDPYETLKIVYNSEHDSLTRLIPIPSSTSDDQNTKDISLNSETKTWVRLFKPPQPQNMTKLLPLIIYFHGGGFVLCSAGSTVFHDLCSLISTQLPAFVVSVDYRLAPENRLPAAYVDAVEALNWVKDQALGGGVNGDDDDQSWLTDKYVDFSKCFLMGSSAGGNIAYNAGVRSLGLDLNPMKIKGLILNQPFIGGVKRTESEIRMKNDRIIPLVSCDLMWDLCLPLGSDRDHVFCNPMVENDDESESGVAHRFVEGEIKCFVDGYKYDPMIDRQKEFVKMLKGKGVKVVAKMDEDGFHGTEVFVKEKAESLVGVLRTFIYGFHGTEVFVKEKAESLVGVLRTFIYDD